MPIVTFLSAEFSWRIAYGFLSGTAAIIAVLSFIALPKGLQGRPLSLLTVIPPYRMLGRAFVRKVPHIYCSRDLVRLLRAARRLPPSGSLRRYTYFTLIGLMACTGMRVGEAVHLGVDDVDLQAGIITVRCSKLHETRILPLHPSTLKQLLRYHRKRQVHFPKA